MKLLCWEFTWNLFLGELFYWFPIFAVLNERLVACASIMYGVNIAQWRGLHLLFSVSLLYSRYTYGVKGLWYWLSAYILLFWVSWLKRSHVAMHEVCSLVLNYIEGWVSAYELYYLPLKYICSYMNENFSYWLRLTSV